jgi:hypothetical protein
MDFLKPSSIENCPSAREQIRKSHLFDICRTHRSFSLGTSDSLFIVFLWQTAGFVCMRNVHVTFVLGKCV